MHGAGPVGQAAVRGVANVAARKGAAELLQGDLGQALKAQLASEGRIGRALTRKGPGFVRATPARIKLVDVLSNILDKDEGDPITKGMSEPEIFKRKIKAMNQLMGNPERLASKAHDLTAGLALIDPELAELAKAQAIQSLQFLQSKMPQDPGTMRSLGGSRWTPDGPAVDKWLRYFKAVSDPAGVVEDFSRGVLTPEAAEALKATSPAHFAEMQRRLLDDPQRLERLTYQERAQLGFLLETPTHPLMNTIPQLQANFGGDDSQGVQQPQPAQGSTQGGKPNTLTSTQSLTLSRG